MSISLTFTTSGTTGEPKAVTHTLEAMIANAMAFNEAAGLGKNTVMYHCLPKTHMAGFLNTILCPTLAGGRVVFGPTFAAQTASSFLRHVVEGDANTVWITPTIAAMLLRLNRDTVDYTRRVYGGRLRHVFCGTAPLPRKIRDDWLSTFGIPLQESYGTSEHMLVSVQGREQAETEHNAGAVLPGFKVEVGASPEGEIRLNGEPTGDIGNYQYGWLTITGRVKDLIIRGGFNVSPATVEEALRKVPGIVDAAVVGQPDAFWGERIMAFAEGAGDLSVVHSLCRHFLPQSHWPDRIEIVDRLPRNEMGKVRKADLR